MEHNCTDLRPLIIESRGHSTDPLQSKFEIFGRTPSFFEYNPCLIDRFWVIDSQMARLYVLECFPGFLEIPVCVSEEPLALAPE